MFDDLMPKHSTAGEAGQGSSPARIKAWAIQHWQLPQDTALLVSELRCGEAGCADVETVIAVLSGAAKGKKVKLNKALSEVCEADIQAIAQGKC
ncbi:MAG: hypothetical protein KTR17_07220 [Cellvibrionaceae bacterium]|nr:hypothetical protein [Cellvibrionaceae bacterium]